MAGMTRPYSYIRECMVVQAAENVRKVTRQQHTKCERVLLAAAV